MRKNINRGYQKLRVWQDAIEYYKQICLIFHNFPYELKRVSSQDITSSDSIHRNIAEGYCRRSINEYLNFINIALDSLGESVSGLFACRNAKQISEEDFQKLDALAYKIENELLMLKKSIERKRNIGEWDDQLSVREINAIYESNL